MDSFPSFEEVLDSCLKHMAEVGWGDFSFEKVAQQHPLPLEFILQKFPSKESVLEAFFTRLDESVVSSLEIEKDTPLKDALLEGLMTRFEKLQPHRTLVQRLYHESFKAPCLGLFLLNQVPQSLKKTLPPLAHEASFLRTHTVFLIYSQSFRIWLEDNSSDLAKTLSHTDKLLERYYPGR